jgi:coiled-coil domain-containing protein 55
MSSSSVPAKAKFIIGEAKKQYGLVLPGASGAATNAPRTGRVAAAFGDDDDDDDNDVGNNNNNNNNNNKKPVPIVRTGAASSSNRMAQAAQSAALAEDAAAFEYDSLYDSMKAKQKAANKAARKDASREPKYIKQLLAKAEERKRDDELYYEKKLLREQAEEMEEFGQTEKFLTSAYRKKMEENRLWREEKDRRDAEIDSRGIAAQGTSALLANIINDRLADDDDDDDDDKANKQNNNNKAPNRHCRQRSC